MLECKTRLEGAARRNPDPAVAVDAGQGKAV